MHITEIRIQNIKKIKALTITPDGSVVKITGPNGNGKSSTLDSIVMALGGKKRVPERAIRDGEETAEIVVKLGDYIVRRHWTKGGKDYLALSTVDGAKITNAQKVLDTIVGELSFDPLAFVSLEPVKRLNLLKKIAKIDFTELDQEYSQKYAERTAVRKNGDSLKLRIEEFKELKELTYDFDSIDDIKKERQKDSDINDQIDSLNNDIFNTQNDIDNKNQSIENKNALILELKEEIKILKKEEKESVKNKKAIEKEVEKLGEKRDLSEYDSVIESFYEQQNLKYKHEQKDKLTKEIEVARDTWNELTKSLKSIEESKEKMVSDAKMPIEGLSLDGKSICFNGIPFSQLCSAEQIKVSMAIAIATNPKLRIAIIYNGSLLDTKSMEQVVQIAKDNNVQVWIEKVADSPEANTIYIEDGEIVN